MSYLGFERLGDIPEGQYRLACLQETCIRHGSKSRKVFWHDYDLKPSDLYEDVYQAPSGEIYLVSYYDDEIKKLASDEGVSWRTDAIDVNKEGKEMLEVYDREIEKMQWHKTEQYNLNFME